MKTYWNLSQIIEKQYLQCYLQKEINHLCVESTNNVLSEQNQEYLDYTEIKQETMIEKL